MTDSAPEPGIEPTLLPARMLNEFAYCPRLAYLEWVQGEFRDSADTVEGRFRHRRVEKEQGNLPDPADAARDDRIHARSVLLESERLGLVARIDLVEGEGTRVTPVDYKRGRPPDNPERAWEPERVQICAQALLLRDHGFACDEGVLYFVQSKQRVPVPIDDDLVRLTLELRDAFRATATSGAIPPPLAGSPKCLRCSLAPICMPDETLLLAGARDGPCGRPDVVDRDPSPSSEQGQVSVRRILPARDDAAPLHLQTQGLSVGLSGDVLEVREKGEKVRDVRLIDVSQLCVYGGVQVTTSAVRELASRGVPVCYFSFGGWFQAIAHGMSHKNVELRRQQYRASDDLARSLALARAFATGKIRNQRTMLRRNHPDAPETALAELARMAEAASRATDRETLLGIEGNAARTYFEHFGALLRCGRGLSASPAEREAESDKPDLPPCAAGRGCPAPPGEVAKAEPDKLLPPPSNSDENSETLDFDFNGRNRRPPADPVNALLSFAYALLVKDLAVTLLAVGFDPFLGFYHQPRYGRPALALDLMEELRPIVADSVVITAINKREVAPKDFLRRGGGVALSEGGRKTFLKAWERRMADEVTHPIFGYAVSYRRVMEIQARLLARHLAGEIPEYPPFETR